MTSEPLNSHVITVRVRYSETDAMGYLHHGNHINYFEMGRTELLRAQGGSYRDMEEQGYFLVVIRAECDYKIPARFDDLLTIRTSVGKQSMAKIEFEHLVFRDGQLLAKGRTVLACINREGQVQRLTEVLPQFQGGSSTSS
jgi:acyl-CoA thioester hydrolase